MTVLLFSLIRPPPGDLSERIYVCSVVTDAEGIQRPAIADKAAVVEWRACILTDASGLAHYSWTVVWAKAADWSSVDTDVDFIRISSDRNATPLLDPLRTRGVLEPLETYSTAGEMLDAIKSKHLRRL